MIHEQMPHTCLTTLTHTGNTSVNLYTEHYELGSHLSSDVNNVGIVSSVSHEARRLFLILVLPCLGRVGMLQHR